MKFMIVDDDAACRALLEDLLHDYAQCETAVDGAEAIEMFRQALDAGEAYDLICLDIMMPHVDGHHALEAIRKIEYERGIYGSSSVKVIMTTALDNSKHCIRAFNEGCESYITKPLDNQLLLDQIRALLGNVLTQKAISPTESNWKSLPESAVTGPGRYLVVDDDRACRELIRAMLKPYGRCDLVYNGQEAIDAVRLALDDRRPYDMISLDIMMPGKSGHEALQEIREVEAEHGVLGSDCVPVIMTTALEDSKHCIQAFKEGCECYVTKPVRADILVAAMRQLGVLTSQATDSAETSSH